MSSPQAAQLATRWKLTGIVVADHDRYAILTDKKRKESKSLGTGAKLDGWVLASIDLDGVKFALGARSVRLPLIEKREGRH